jgi:hypothetical protein
MEDKSDMIYDLLKTERKEANEFRKEVRESHGDITERLMKIELLDEEQNKHLSEHIRRTNLLEDLHKDNAVRIAKLEEPIKVMGTLKRWLIGIGAIGGAIVGICKFIGLF